jgi:hypothetical protein
MIACAGVVLSACGVTSTIEDDPVDEEQLETIQNALDTLQDTRHVATQIREIAEDAAGEAMPGLAFALPNPTEALEAVAGALDGEPAGRIRAASADLDKARSALLVTLVPLAGATTPDASDTITTESGADAGLALASASAVENTTTEAMDAVVAAAEAAQLETPMPSERPRPKVESIAAECGNGSCEPGETAQSCPQDCAGGNTCGTGTCDAHETAQLCPQDCGGPMNNCGDGSCSGGETPQSCPQDCGGPVNSCGDGSCSGGETPQSCPWDCGTESDL